MQTAIIQSQIAESPSSLPLTASEAEQVPALASPYHVLVRILAVALNPNDHKMLTHFPRPGYGAGCDFCGIVERLGNLTGENQEHDLDLVHQLGTRVCGTVFPYAPVDAGINTLGAFAEFVAVDARLLLRVPSSWTDLQGAALGGVGWSTVALAMSARDALALPGLPSTPAEKKIPVLVYGGGTATGTMAAQLLNLCVFNLYWPRVQMLTWTPVGLVMIQSP
jgi:NADPH:quinone reductase-like Zn-dependent oxidoreductase